MKLVNGIEIVKNKKNEVWSNITGEWRNYPDFNDAYDLVRLKSICRSSKYDDTTKLNMLSTTREAFLKKFKPEQVLDETQIELQKQQKINKLNDSMQKLINFFSEFSFEPNFRFVNTFSRMCQYQTNEQAIDYINNYFTLTDNSYAVSINEKMKSAEFFEILDTFRAVPTNKVINKRFKLYYGSQGTGKTTEAMKEANNNVMVCHSAMLPSDLMEDFKFDNGKAAFAPSALCKAMTNGDIIVLDEINLLPFESLRFLQSILDGKTQFDYKGQTINIKDGFKIIGTMNLQVNGCTYALPEPLVDRAEELKKFTLTADKLMSAII